MGKMRLEETPKDQTAIRSEVPGPQLKMQPSAPTHFRSLAQSNAHCQKRFIRYWLLLDPREENIDGRRIKVFHCLEGCNKPSSLLSALCFPLFLQALARLKSKRHIPVSTVRSLNSEPTSSGRWPCGCRIYTICSRGSWDKILTVQVCSVLGLAKSKLKKRRHVFQSNGRGAAEPGCRVPNQTWQSRASSGQRFGLLDFGRFLRTEKLECSRNAFSYIFLK